ncbi:MAG: hypothetical protein K2X38_11235 [Gemmataceae bacterium]|nr:hypothetical protein [Gemmataceae bacterium]
MIPTFLRGLKVEKLAVTETTETGVSIERTDDALPMPIKKDAQAQGRA